MPRAIFVVRRIYIGERHFRVIPDARRPLLEILRCLRVVEKEVCRCCVSDARPRPVRNTYSDPRHGPSFLSKEQETLGGRAPDEERLRSYLALDARTLTCVSFMSTTKSASVRIILVSGPSSVSLALAAWSPADNSEQATRRGERGGSRVEFVLSFPSVG